MSDQPASLAEALAILQTRLPRIGKDQTATIPTKTGGAYGYKYADLATISRELLPVMGNLGLSFSCMPTRGINGEFDLLYVLRHVSGEQQEGTYPLPQGSPQAIGSAITYARRYCLCAVTGCVADEDDDAAEAETDSARPTSERYRSAHADPEHQRLVHGSDERITDQGRAIRRTSPDDESASWEGPQGDLAAPTAPEDSPGTATNDQKWAIVREFDRLGIYERKARIEEMCRGIGRQVESSRELSMTEAARELKRLKALPTPEKEPAGDNA